MIKKTIFSLVIHTPQCCSVCN